MMSAQEYVNELSRYTFLDPRIQVHSDCMEGRNAVCISIQATYFASVDPEVGPWDGRPIALYRQELIHMDHPMPPEQALRWLWRTMWDHEFQEQLCIDTLPVHDPHGTRKKLEPSAHPHPRSDDEIYRRGDRERLLRYTPGGLFRQPEEGSPDPGAPYSAPSNSKRNV